MSDQNKKILIIDDDEIHLTFVKSILNTGYIISAAKSGKEALQLIYKGFIPDLVLLDILMPEMDGWETYHRLKAIAFLQSIPIAFLTTVTEEEAVEKAHDLGASDFITKPCSRNDLISRVNKLLETEK
jgi:putative two-component system response regulator